MSQRASNAGYAKAADDLLDRYESLDPNTVHAHWRAFFPATRARILDIGAGTGRDAAWLAALGHSVLAVEPTDALREGAQKLHPEPQITWLDDRLPELSLVSQRDETFELVLLNAVWMHLDAEERRVGFETLSALTAPGGRICMSLRHGPIPETRHMFDVSGAETIALAHQQGFRTLYKERSASLLAENQNRGVEWTCLVFEKS